jgi:hypothetical protein
MPKELTFLTKMRTNVRIQVSVNKNYQRGTQHQKEYVLKQPKKTHILM